MESFFQLKTPQEVFEIIVGFSPLGEETLPFEQTLHRVLSQDVFAPEDLPSFHRATMDGYALKAKETFGAGDSLPALFEVIGEIHMGEESPLTVQAGQAVKIATGAMLPKGSDGVVMVEYCSLLDSRTLEVNRAITPLENVIQPGDDCRKGSPVLPSGHRLRPQDLGLLAALGIRKIPVFLRPRIGILSTGDEIVPVEALPRPGQVRDVNRYTIGALCQREGAIPVYAGLCRDDFDSLEAAVKGALEKSDALFLSGGSSVGTRDLTLQVFETLPDFELLVHGISISPGKPTILARSGDRPLVGLPGHVASALVVAEVFMTRLIHRLTGMSGFADARSRPSVAAELSQNVDSPLGREDYVRVRLRYENGRTIAQPVFGKSGLISTLVEADGLVRIEMNAEGLYRGQLVNVLPFYP